MAGNESMRTRLEQLEQSAPKVSRSYNLAQFHTATPRFVGTETSTRRNSLQANGITTGSQRDHNTFFGDVGRFLEGVLGILIPK